MIITGMLPPEAYRKCNTGWKVSALFQKLLLAFRKRNHELSSDSAHIPLTPVRMSEHAGSGPNENPAPTLIPIVAKASAAVIADAPVPVPELEFDVARTVDDAHSSVDKPELNAQTHNSIDVAAGSDPTDRLPAVIASKPKSPPIATGMITRTGDEDTISANKTPAIEHLSHLPPEDRPSAENPEDFQRIMRPPVGRDLFRAMSETADVLKILGFEKGDLVSPPFEEPLPRPAPEKGDVPLPFEPASGIETNLDSEIIPDSTTGDGLHAVVGEHNSTPWTKRPIGDVLLDGHCSVRLSNCIAANQSFFSSWVIGRTITHRSEFAAALMNVRNLGRKTANEVLDALDAFARASRCGHDGQGIEEDEQTPDSRLTAFDPATLEESITVALRSRDTTTRLANLIATGAIDDIKIRDFLLHPDDIRARMMNCKKAGQKTVTEAIDILSGYIEALLHPVAEAPSVHTQNDPPEGLTTRQWLEEELAALPSNRVEVLNSRYGLDGLRPVTLQEIAHRVHVTRERVRQVEAGAIKRLRAGVRSRAAFTRYLAEAKDSQWSVLFGPQSTIPEDEVSERFRRLDPWFLLSIDIVFKDGCDGYLNANAYKSAGRWFKSSGEAGKLQKLDHLMGEILGIYKTPMPLDTLEKIAPSASAVLPVGGESWSQHAGYIYNSFLGSKAKRVGRIHTIARRIACFGIFDIGTLIIEYRSDFPDDRCSSRVFEMQVNEAPHLFAPLFDGMWLCLDNSRCLVEHLPAPPFERRRIEETNFAEGSLGDMLVKKLEQFGPQRLIDLRRAITDSAQGSLSESSVGAVLISNPCFRRAAPGIFGLYTEDSGVSAALDALIVGERHCRFYCQARYSGAPLDYYPLWGANYEMRLAIWARQHAANDLYRSLLAVINPETWPAQIQTIAEFQALCSADGRWEIGAERRLPLGHRFLGSGQFLAVLTHLVVFGWISWIGVNRSTGSRPDNHDAADVLAFFVMTGLVEPQSDWQAPHYPTELAINVFLEAKWERHLNGHEASGNKDVFGRLRSMLYEAPPAAKKGWVDIEEFTAALPAWQSEGIWMGKAFGGAQPRQPAINAEEAFESDEWDAVFGG